MSAAPTHRKTRASSTPGPRTPRLVIGRHIDAGWTLDDADWLELASVYSRPFEDAIRSKTPEAVTWRAGFEAIGRSFISDITRERAAPAKGDADGYLADIAKKAAALAEAIEGSGLNPLARSMARADIDARLSRRDWCAADDAEAPPPRAFAARPSSPRLVRRLRRKGVAHAPLMAWSVDIDDAPPALPLNDLAAHARDTAQAAVEARHALQGEETMKDGDAWARFIQSIVNFCARHNLPCGVSADSSFVAFLAALESKLPEHVRPQARKPGALAKAINRALKAD